MGALFVVFTLIAAAGQASVPASGVVEVSAQSGHDATEPAIAAAEAGSYVVLWTRDEAPNPVLARSYSLGGTALTGTRRVGFRGFSQLGVAASSDPDGNLVLAWEAGDILGDPLELVLGRLAEPDLGDAGDPRRLGFVDDSLDELSVATSPSGEFAMSYNNSLAFEDHFVQVFDSDGVAISARTETSPGLSNEDPDVAALDDGEFVAAWEDFLDGSVDGRRFSAAGFTDSSFLISTAGDHVAVSGHPSGKFVAVWDGPSGIQAARFDSSGFRIGDILTIADGSFPDVVMRDDQSFVAAWQSDTPIGGNPGIRTIRAAEFDDDNAPLGGIYQVSEPVVDVRHEKPVLAAMGGGFAVAWRATGGGEARVQARGFRPQTQALALSVTGSCPGTATFSLSGATPDEAITIAVAESAGTFTRPDGECAGMRLGLATPLATATVSADGNGTFTTELDLTGDACGTFVQALELARCTSSPVAVVP